MKSSGGKYYAGLDHVRALAIFLVVTWHFIHDGRHGYPVPLSFVPNFFPFSILDEGHTGVALFMTLSGYLFTKLLDGKSIHYGAFLWNRCLRLFPLMFLVVVIVGINQALDGRNIYHYIHRISRFLVSPTLPNGGWSVTIEFHFYLILPVLMWLMRKSKFLPLSIVLVALAYRYHLYQTHGRTQFLAYVTLVGRIDQFVLGMLAYNLRSLFTRRHGVVIAVLLAFTAFYWFFDTQGGAAREPAHASVEWIWVILPTIEGFAYSIGIAWYDNSFSHSTSGISRFIARIGEYSYSIYLLHMFVVFYAARFVNERVMDISNFYIACLWSAVFLVIMMIPAHFSYRYLELPFLKLRKPYIKRVSENYPSIVEST